MARWRPPAPAVKTKLVQNVIAAWVRNAPKLREQAPVLQDALVALDKDLQRVDREQKQQDVEDAAEVAREEARKNPSVSVQKTMAILRKAGLRIATYNNRSGHGTGLEVSYGDWDRRTWVKVSHSFAWDFSHSFKTREQATVKEKQMVADDLFGTGMRALQAAGLSAEPVRAGTNHLLHYLKVTK